MTARTTRTPATDAEEQAALERRLVRDVGRAVADFAMVTEGDRVLCAAPERRRDRVLVFFLERLRRASPIEFEIVVAEPGEGRDVATLQAAATRTNATKIATSDVREDVLVALLERLVFDGELATIAPFERREDEGPVVVRPLLFASEPSVDRFAELTWPEWAPDETIASDDRGAALRAMLADLDERSPGARASMLAALRNVRPTHLFDARLWRSLGLSIAPPDDEARLVSPSTLSAPRRK